MRRVNFRAVSFGVLAITLLSGAICLGQTPPPKSNRAQTSRPKVPPKPEPQDAPEQAAEAVSGPQWTSISVVRIKPEMVNEWVDLNKTTIIPALKKAGVKSRDAWLTAQFGEAFEYLFVTPIENFGQYDGESPIRKGLGEEAYKAYLEKVRRVVASVHTVAARPRDDLSYNGKTTWPPKLVVLATIQVAQGRTADFEGLIKTDVLPAIKKVAGPGYFVNQTVLGGDINTFFTVTPYDTFADIGKGAPLEKGMGDAGYSRFLRKTVGVIVRVDRTVYGFNPELSF